MERNQIFGIGLIFLLVLAYTYFNAPSDAELARQQQVQDSLEQIKILELEKLTSAPAEPEEIVVPDSVKIAQNMGNYGDFASATVGNESLSTLENDQVKITFSNKGAVIKEVLLKNHYKFVKDSSGQKSKINLRLLEDRKNTFEYLLPIQNGTKTLRTSDLYFEVQKSDDKLTFVAGNASSGQIRQEYTLKGDFTLDYQVSFDGLQNELDPSKNSILLNWENYLDKLELNEQFERMYSTVYYKEDASRDSDYCSCRADDKEELEKKLNWVAHTNQFFNASLIASNSPFEAAELRTEMLNEEDENLKLITSKIEIPYGHSARETFDMQWYVGPNEYTKLKSFGNGLEEIIPFGRSIFGSINRHVIRPSFNFLTGFISSKGIVIILLILIIKLLLYPLMYKMLKSQAKMSALKPEIAKLTEKYKDDAQKKQMETMKIYQEYGVSPFGGCMPMVMQMPIWYALFRFFPASITFRQVPFLWADDLSSFDVLFWLPFEIPMFGAHLSLFTILWAVTTVIYTYYNTKHMDMSANPAMKYVQYFMPLIFLVFFNSYAAGLTCYMFFSNLFNIALTIGTKKFVFDDAKIKAELTKQKAKPKKKSGFRSRLEEAMKQQQQIQQQRAKQKKK